MKQNTKSQRQDSKDFWDGIDRVADRAPDWAKRAVDKKVWTISGRSEEKSKRKEKR